MNITKTNTEIPFPSLESKINWWVTSLLQITFFGLFLFFFCLFVLGPVYGIYKRGWEAMLSAALVCWTISLLILIPVIRYFFIKRKKVANKIVIDGSGLLFFNSKNQVAEQILYKELSSSKQDFDIYTVAPVGSSMVPLLEVSLQQEKKYDEIRRIDMNLPLHVVKNKVPLYAHFIHGISVFRPDLKIDPMVLRTFSINPNTWEIKKSKGISSGSWLLILAVLVITGLICGFVFLLSR
ncbi:hypothetical protein [Chryseobacterium jejuense]|uniref:Uncharacterized protein n=1 Tax=Chryseobacterium jejuense TaxID=445960 RepID=A0A2X2X8Y1_CHRJE|nr:hypothetical protein [Chryseobacterium jejuense]SDI18248.1 hypothetical protein SAMN05421542_0344 [Chryseobacterium jejuense]SQB46613.1 Uncharacterised protein [Chryseobacterium jejuense]